MHDLLDTITVLCSCLSWKKLSRLFKKEQAYAYRMKWNLNITVAKIHQAKRKFCFCWVKWDDEWRLVKLILYRFFAILYYGTAFGTVKLANSASPFKFRQVKIQQQAGLENNKMCFSQTVSIAFSLYLVKIHFIILNTQFFNVFLCKFDLAEFERTGGIS